MGRLVSDSDAQSDRTEDQPCNEIHRVVIAKIKCGRVKPNGWKHEDKEKPTMVKPQPPHQEQRDARMQARKHIDAIASRGDKRRIRSGQKATFQRMGEHLRRGLDGRLGRHRSEQHDQHEFRGRYPRDYQSDALRVIRHLV